MNPTTDFLKTAGRVINSGQSRSIVLTGNIHDLFRLKTDDGVEYVPLVNLVASRWSVSSKIIVIYELNGPIRFVRDSERLAVRDAWLKWRTGMNADQIAIQAMLSTNKVRNELKTMSSTFDANLDNAVGNPTVALELLRQMCVCSRTIIDGVPLLRDDFVIIIEAADLVIPEGEISRLSDADRHRVSVCQDWFSDPGFLNGGDTVALLAESKSLINHRIARLPQMIEIGVPSPTQSERELFVDWFDQRLPSDQKLKLWSTRDDLARFTAGLSIHALSQLLKGAKHENRQLVLSDVISKVEEYIQSQLGDDIVEFKKPSHSLKDVVGFSKLKTFLKEQLIPRFRATGAASLSGAAVSGPIGGGKTFIFEAVAGELDMVVLVLKNIRSQWFGQTDVIFERLRRVLDALAKALIFVDEADTQFGGVGPETHDTERRLTGRIQAMMSDPALRGRILWLLMTARIHLLSPDIRRPGRAGDLIIPVLDPEGDDRKEFLLWTVRSSLKDSIDEPQTQQLLQLTQTYSAASFASLKSELKAAAALKGDQLSFDEVRAVIQDALSPAIGLTRRYQTLQALVNCTRKSLLPDPTVGEPERRAWDAEIRALEAMGIR
ncbi:MAG: ATP-binding protein [Planctomycetota bacterium]